MTDAPDHCRQLQHAIGVDVGGTKIAAGVVEFPNGAVLARRQQPTCADHGGQAVLDHVAGLVQSLQHDARGLGVEVDSLGVGVAELVGRRGEVLSGATIHWNGMPVGEMLHVKTGLPVVVEADVRAAARGEAHFGAGRSLETFLYVTVGTGISASLVIDGLPYTGARGLTGTLASSRGLFPGHGGELVAGPSLEEFASGPALAARMLAECNRFTGSCPEVLALAEQGDARAKIIVTSAGQALGAAIAHLVNVLDPEAVVLGGGLGLTEGLYRSSLDAALREQIWSDVHRDVPLLSAELGPDAGFIGAALSSLRH